MPPRSKKADAGAEAPSSRTAAANGKEEKPAPPSSRRSARIAGDTPLKEEESKKRSGDGETEASKSTTSKKAKTEVVPDSKAKATTTSSKSKSKTNGKTTTETIPEESAEEKKEEAPASAKPTTSGSKVLAKGDKLPSIKLEKEDGEEVDVSKLTEGNKGVVLFLYPKADTPGCTNQACGFRDHFEDISSLGYDIYGLSKDKAAAQKRWKEKKTLNYSLLCDPESKLIKRLGAFVAPNNTKRSHFIFEKGTGKLVDIAIGVKPAEDPKKCLEFIKKLDA